jgi:hypothetical protein
LDGGHGRLVQRITFPSEQFFLQEILMSRSLFGIRGNFLAAMASIAMAGAVGCASHSSSSGPVQVPPNTVAPTPSSIRDLGDLTTRSLANNGPTTDAKTLTGGAVSRGFDFGDNGGGGGGGGGSSGGPLNFDQLGQMLSGIGGNPQVNNGVYVYNIKDDSGLTYPLGVTLSQDQRAIYFVIPMVNVDQSWATQDALLKLLAANSSICPACFGIVQTRLFLMMGIPNNNVSPDLLKQALAYVFDTMHRTQPLWGPWLQQGAPQNEGGPAGGNQGGGNQGGGAPGGGNGGGNSGNPFSQ